jgi:hypothetical protein
MSRTLAIKLFALALCAAYIALLYTPLRLAGDSPLYLCDATDLSHGRGFHDDHLPQGYPRALAALELFGFVSAAGIVALNLVSIATGLVCVSTVLRRELGLSGYAVKVISLLSCCSWMWIALITFPLSDLLFFSLSSMALAMLSLSKDRPRVQSALYVATAVVVATAAFYVRTIGAALFAAIVIAVLETSTLRRFMTRRTVIVLFSIGIVATGLLGFKLRDRIASSWYSGALSYLTNTGRPFDTTREIVWWRLAELGELAQNVSSTALVPTTPNLRIESTSPGVLFMLQMHALRIVVGSVALVLILVGLWSRRRQFSTVEAYLLAFMGILLIWPFDDPRFLAPVVPLLFGYAWLGLRSLRFQPQSLQRFATAYSAVFCLLGVIALADSLDVTYFDRLRPWRECGVYVPDIPSWLTAFDRYGGVRPQSIRFTPRPPRFTPR